MRGRETLGILGVGAFAVICCAGLPAVLAFAGSLTLAGYLGGGLIAAVVVGCAAMLLLRARRRRDCAHRSLRGDADR